jgi:DNA-binding NarL/FixJ family response regulator
MPQQATASIAFQAQPAVASTGRATVRSIESARRLRSRRLTRAAIRVLVVSSHAITRAGLRRLLEDDAGLAVVGEAGTAANGVQLGRSTAPDVVILDAACFDPDCLASTRALAARVPVLLLADSDAEDRMRAALRPGVTGVLAEDSHPAELASAVRTLARGGALLPPRTTLRLVTELANAPSTSQR